MKLVILFAFVAVAVARPDDYNHNEDFDVDEVINNENLLQGYCDCFMGTGKCTPESSHIKKLLPEAIQNTCIKCSEKEKSLVGKVIIAIKTRLPEECEKLKKIYNPDCKYDSTFNEFLRKYGH